MGTTFLLSRSMVMPWRCSGAVLRSPELPYEKKLVRMFDESFQCCRSGNGRRPPTALIGIWGLPIIPERLNEGATSATSLQVERGI